MIHDLLRARYLIFTVCNKPDSAMDDLLRASELSSFAPGGLLSRLLSIFHLKYLEEKSALKGSFAEGFVQCTNNVLKWQLVQLVHFYVSKSDHLCKQL